MLNFIKKMDCMDWFTLFIFTYLMVTVILDFDEFSTCKMPI